MCGLRVVLIVKPYRGSFETQPVISSHNHDFGQQSALVGENLFSTHFKAEIGGRSKLNGLSEVDVYRVS